MRTSFLVVVLCALQGCTALSAGLAADLNRQRRADARVDVAADTTLGPGDVLTVRLRSGRTLFGTVVAADADTLRLDAGAVAVREVAHAERPWRRQSVGRAAAVGVAADAAAAWLFIRSLRISFGGLRLS